MWLNEQDLSDDLRSPLVAYRKRRLCHGLIGGLLSVVSIVFIIESVFLSVSPTLPIEIMTSMVMLSLLTFISGALQLWRYWCSF